MRTTYPAHFILHDVSLNIQVLWDVILHHWASGSLPCSASIFMEQSKKKWTG